MLKIFPLLYSYNNFRNLIRKSNLCAEALQKKILNNRVKGKINTLGFQQNVVPIRALPGSTYQPLLRYSAYRQKKNISHKFGYQVEDEYKIFETKINKKRNSRSENLKM